MKVIQFSECGDYDVLKIAERPLPDVQSGQVLVKIELAAVNPVDDTLRKGIIRPAKFPMIPGNEGVGIVEQGNAEFPAGTRVSLSCFNPSGQVRGIYIDGAWQEYIAAWPSELLPIPAGVSSEAAAAFPVAYFSAQACLNKAEFAPGKSVLSLGIGGAVGNAAVQLARASGASLVISTAGSSRKAEQARQAGFENIIDLSAESISEGVARITAGKGVDIVVDSIGGPLTGESIHSLSRNGILVAIGYSAGAQFTANITDFVWKGLQMRGQSLNGWFDLPAQQKVWGQLLPLLAEDRIKPAVARVFGAGEIASAQRFLAEQRPFGKVLVRFHA
ncbi:MAG TPA: zinc-binding alcohol dehydrogenase family protein [Puia sp.]